MSGDDSLQARHMVGMECATCRVQKPAAAFSFNPREPLNGGFSKDCTDCLDAAYQAKARDRELRKKYGITLADYDAMLKKQRGRCAICKKPPTPKRRLAVDHDHETGKVRGLLCGRCNLTVGSLEDDIGMAVDMAAYLHRNA